jgi:hypothetical protein
MRTRREFITLLGGAINRSDTFTFGNVISGTGALQQNGPGTAECGDKVRRLVHLFRRDRS